MNSQTNQELIKRKHEIWLESEGVMWIMATLITCLIVNELDWLYDKEFEVAKKY